MSGDRDRDGVAMRIGMDGDGNRDGGGDGDRDGMVGR